MRPSFFLRSIVVVGLSLGLFAGDAFAGFFRRYPDATEESKPAAPPRPAQTDVGDVTEAYAPREEPEEDPGLFRSLPHGHGGLTVEYIYTGEVFTNMRGGLNTNRATVYRGNLDLVMTADLDEIGFAPGGTFFLYGQNGHGQGLTDRHVGGTQGVSNLVAQDFMQVSEFWWERGFCDDVFRLRIGKQDGSATFAFTELGGDFINPVFAVPQTMPLPTFPDPTMAAIAFVQLTEDLVFQCGVFDGAASGSSWGFSRTGEPFTIFEFRGNYESLRGMPGQFHVGMWHHDGVFENPADPGITHHSNRGVFLGADQLIFKENVHDADDDQGLGVLGQYSWAPQDRSAVTQSFIVGLAYKGLLCCRDDDITGIGVGNATFSNLTPALVDETIIELFYKLQLTPYTVLQPDLQYIASPSGAGRDAFVAGLRFEVVL